MNKVLNFQKPFRDKHSAFWQKEISGWAESLIQFFKDRKNSSFLTYYDYLFLFRRLTLNSTYNYLGFVEKAGRDFGIELTKKLFILNGGDEAKADTAGRILYERSITERDQLKLPNSIDRVMNSVVNSLRNTIDTAISQAYNQNYSQEEFISDISSKLMEYAEKSNVISTVTATLSISIISSSIYQTFSYPFKMWVAVEDERTRESHLIVSGTVVPIDMPFEVGSSYMMYPCDPNGGLEEIINCRCYLVPVGSNGEEESKQEAEEFYEMFE